MISSENKFAIFPTKVLLLSHNHLCKFIVACITSRQTIFRFQMIRKIRRSFEHCLFWIHKSLQSWFKLDKWKINVNYLVEIFYFWLNKESFQVGEDQSLNSFIWFICILDDLKFNVPFSGQQCGVGVRWPVFSMHRLYHKQSHDYALRLCPCYRHLQRQLCHQLHAQR